MVAKAKSLANTMLESSDCTKVIGARSMKRLQNVISARFNTLSIKTNSRMIGGMLISAI
jgi:hypothetical protein